MTEVDGSSDPGEPSTDSAVAGSLAGDSGRVADHWEVIVTVLLGVLRLFAVRPVDRLLVRLRSLHVLGRNKPLSGRRTSSL